MPRYAVYDTGTGRIKAQIELSDGYLEIVGPLDEGRKMVLDGEIIDCPEVELVVSEPVTAEQPAAIALRALESAVQFGKTGVQPERFDLLINNKVLRWRLAKSIIFDETGDYCIKIVGPWPWASNQVRFTVQEAPAEPEPAVEDSGPGE